MIYFEMKIGEPQEVKIMRAKDEGKVNKNVTTEEVARIAQATVDAQQFKTINGEDIRGTGNIEIQGGGDVTSVNGQKGDVVIDIPKKTSQLQNDSKYINQSSQSSTYNIEHMWVGNQSQYDALETKDARTLFIII